MKTAYRHSEVQMDRIVETAKLVSELSVLRNSDNNDERELFYNVTRDLAMHLNAFYEVR